MNILYLCDEYPPGRIGGIGTAVQTLAREMVRQGNNVVVAGFYDWGFGGMDQFEDEGVKVFRFRRGLSSGIFGKQDSLIVRALYKVFKKSGVFQWDIERSMRKYRLFLEELIKTYAVDIVEMPDYNDYMRFCNSYVSFPKLSIPTIIKLHGSLVYFMEEAGQKVPANIWTMEHKLLAQAEGVSSVSKYTAERTAKYLDYNREISVLYNGIEEIKLTDVAKVPNRVIFAGSLAKKKGIYQLLKAWNFVHETNPEAQLFIYGKGRVDIISLLNEQAADTVHFVGHVSREKLLMEFARSGIAVFPSFAESFGLTAIEAMSCGTATIFTKTTSGPEVIENQKSGLLIDPGSVKDIADNIILLLTDKELCDKIAVAGKKHVTEKFAIRLVAEANVQYYKTIIDHMKNAEA